MSDISEWRASDVVAALNDHYRPDPTDPDWWVCERCEAHGHHEKVYVDFEDEDERIPVPATLEQVTHHERIACPYRDDAV